MKKINGNVLVIKEINVSIVRNALKKMKNGTKAQISKSTGLTTATVGTILQTLLKDNEINENGKVKSNGGRPAQEFSYNFDYMNALIIYPFEEKGKTMLNVNIVNLDGVSVCDELIEVEILDIKQLKLIIDEKIKEFPKIRQIAFGNPGVNLEGKIVQSDYKGLIGFDLSKEFEVPIIIENNVNSAVMGFRKRRKGETSNWSYFFFSEEYSPRAGMLINGDIHKGSNNYAGEISCLSDIGWGKELYSDFEKFCKNISKVINMTSCLLNPDAIILAGNFLTEQHLEYVRNDCKQNLIEDMNPKIYLSKNFYLDYKEGLIIKALEALVPDVSITRK